MHKLDWKLRKVFSEGESFRPDSSLTGEDFGVEGHPRQKEPPTPTSWETSDLCLNKFEEGSKIESGILGVRHVKQTGTRCFQTMQGLVEKAFRLYSKCHMF